MNVIIELDNPDGTARWDIATLAYDISKITGRKRVEIIAGFTKGWKDTVIIYETKEETIYMHAIHNKN